MTSMKNSGNYCGNCGGYLDKRDICGTRRGEGAFLPQMNRFETLYGPPVKLVFRCTDCGKTWSENTLGFSSMTKYCPVCGKKTALKCKSIELLEF